MELLKEAIVLICGFLSLDTFGRPQHWQFSLNYSTGVYSEKITINNTYNDYDSKYIPMLYA